MKCCLRKYAETKMQKAALALQFCVNTTFICYIFSYQFHNEKRDKHFEHVLSICDLKNIMQKVLTFTVYTEADISRKRENYYQFCLFNDSDAFGCSLKNPFGILSFYSFRYFTQNIVAVSNQSVGSLSKTQNIFYCVLFIPKSTIKILAGGFMHYQSINRCNYMELTEEAVVFSSDLIPSHLI